MDIVLEHIFVAYDERTVLRDLCGTIPEGRVTVLTGKSGAGKTTLLKVILGRILPAGGRITGNDRRFSAVFQEDRLLENLSARGNVRFVTGDAMADGEIDHLLASLGLAEKYDIPVREFSGGMKRRVAIARALAGEHDALILDEPFKGLDAETRADVARVIKERETGKTLILVTHDAEEADLLGADHILAIPDPE